MRKRKTKAIQQAAHKCADLVWFRRHVVLRQMRKMGMVQIEPETWEDAEKVAAMLEYKYPTGELYPQSEFEWGMLNGKLSALRWALGADWDVLDT